MSGGIEERILSDIESATGESFDSDTGDDDVASTERGQQPDQQDQVTEQLGRRTRPQEGDDADLRQPLKQAPAKEKDQRDGLRRNKAGQLIDKKGNLVDEQGKLITDPDYGLPRRLHTQLERTRAVNKSLELRNQELARQLGEREFLNGAPAKLGLDNNDLADAMQLAAVFKKSPVDAARAVIERALAAGASLHQIVNDEFIPNVTIAATQRLLDERLGPLSRNLKEQESVNRVNQQANEKGNKFLADYPDAIHHSDIIAERMEAIMEQYRGQGVELDPYVAAEKAFEQVLVFCQKKGLDITKPLRPQVEERAKQAEQMAQRRPGRGVPPQNRVRRPIPNGRVGGELLDTKSRAAGPDDSYRSIVAAAMREEGYDI